MIKFDEWQKIDFRIGEIIDVNGENIKITCRNKEFFIKLKLDVKKGNKIAVIINNEKLVIPVVNGNIPLIPDKDIEVGSRVS